MIFPMIHNSFAVVQHPNLPIVSQATCLGVASPKLHLVTRAATLVESMSTACHHHPKMYQDDALKSWNLLHSHTHVWKEMTYAKHWCVAAVQWRFCKNSQWWILGCFMIFGIFPSPPVIAIAIRKKTKQQFVILLMRSFQSFQGTFSTRLRHMEYKTLALLLTWWPKKRLRLQKWNPNPQGGTNILPTYGKTLKSSFKLTFMVIYIYMYICIYIWLLITWRIKH